MSFFGINFGGGNADIDIILDNQDDRKMAEIKDENGRKEKHFLFLDGETVSGKVNVTLHRKTNRLEHLGLKIWFVGQIELYYDRGNHHEFLSLVKQLAEPGELTQNTSFDFEFNQVEKPFECYTGANVRLRYFLHVSLIRRLKDIVREVDLAVHTLATYPEMNNPIKMEVGIEECVHIEFEYNKSKYHLKDVIVGKIYFLLVRIKIKYMEVAIIKRETTGSGPNTLHENETIAKYEIMDGAPVRGESIPIRVFLAGYDLTPTMRDINKKFSVKYFLNLVLVDEEERRYFKQQEITLWRKGDHILRKGQAASEANQIPQAMARHVTSDQPNTTTTQNSPLSAATLGDANTTSVIQFQKQECINGDGSMQKSTDIQAECAKVSDEEEEQKEYFRSNSTNGDPGREEEEGIEQGPLEQDPSLPESSSSQSPSTAGQEDLKEESNLPEYLSSPQTIVGKLKTSLEEEATLKSNSSPPESPPPMEDNFAGEIEDDPTLVYSEPEINDQLPETCRQ